MATGRMLWLSAAIVSAATAAAAAGATGSVPLRDVMKAASNTTHLNTEITLALYREQLKKDEIFCAGAKLANDWKRLSGTRVGPYECRLGGRKLMITTKPVYFDANGHMLAAGDAELKSKAVRLIETGIKWSWQPVVELNPGATAGMLIKQ